MEESKQQQQQQHQESSGGRPADLNLTDKKISPKEENIGSGNPSSNADEVAASANTTTSQLESTYTSGPLPTLATQESTYFYGGYVRRQRISSVLFWFWD